MATFHFILQGKGGVGKTLVSAMLTQALQQHEKDILCIDTDSVNHTFSQYRAFAAVEFDIYNQRTNALHLAEFDRMVEYLIEQDKTTVIDNGASSFVPLTQYIIENDLFQALDDMGHTVTIHTILTGGQGMEDTASGLQSLIDSTPAHVGITVWLNDHFGDISLNGKGFCDWPIYQQNASRIQAVVPLSFRKSALFQDDIRTMATNKQTFDEAIAGGRLMNRTRLGKMKTEIFAAIDQALAPQPAATAEDVE